MSAIGVVAFVPIDAELRPTPRQADAVLEAMRALATVESRCTLESGGERIALYPVERDAAIAQMTLRDGVEFVPFEIAVVRHDQPQEVSEPDSQRYCGACKQLVSAHAICSACGVEEDPSEWKMGPPKLLFSAAFELKLVFQGGPDVWRRSDPQVEREFRQYLGGALEASERILGTRLRMVRYVVA